MQLAPNGQWAIHDFMLGRFFLFYLLCAFITHFFWVCRLENIYDEEGGTYRKENGKHEKIKRFMPWGKKCKDGGDKDVSSGEIKKEKSTTAECVYCDAFLSSFITRRTEGEWRLKRKGLEIDLWLTSPQREPHSGNCSFHTKQQGCLHYSSPAVKHAEAVRVRVE